MAVKTLTVKMAMVDTDTICTLYKALGKLPCMLKYDHIKNELRITAQPHILLIAKKVVAKYV